MSANCLAQCKFHPSKGIPRVNTALGSPERTIAVTRLGQILSRDVLSASRFGEQSGRLHLDQRRSVGLITQKKAGCVNSTDAISCEKRHFNGLSRTHQRWFEQESL
jgi:hypothetical protein